jgi:hypothetical protein
MSIVVVVEEEDLHRRNCTLSPMTRWAAVALGLGLAGCFQPRTPVDHRIRLAVTSPDRSERDREFQVLCRAPADALPWLKLRMQEGAGAGFPCVALLVNLGEGDAVPLELKVAHLAKFEWPARYAEVNRVIEPYCWNEVERDVAKAGRPALRLLGEALAREAPDEARAMRVARVMLQLGGAAPAVVLDEFARLLGVERSLGAVRVCDVAGAAILHLCYQDVALYHAGDPAAAARARLDALRTTGEETWIRMGADAALDAMRHPTEGATWRDWLKRLTGSEDATLASTVKDVTVKEWGGVKPGMGEAELVARVRAGSWNAERVLERRSGVRLRRHPPMRTLHDLRTARWDPRPDPQAALRWERWLESRMLRLGIFRLGADAGSGTRGVLWKFERWFHATEDETAVVEGESDSKPGQLYVQSLDAGTRLVVSDFVLDGEVERGNWRLEGVDGETPVVVENPALTTLMVVMVDDAERRSAPLPPEESAALLLRRLVAMLSGRGAAASARALGYLGDPTAAGALRKWASTVTGETRKTPAAALILLGDPAGLELGVEPALAPHELEMAKGLAKEAKLVAWLQARDR